MVYDNSHWKNVFVGIGLIKFYVQGIGDKLCTS